MRCTQAIFRFIKNIFRISNIKVIWITVITFLFVSTLWFITNERFHSHLLEKEQKNVYNDLKLKGSLFLNTIDSRFCLIYGLEAYVNSRLTENREFSNFSTFAEEIYTNVDGIRSLNISPAGITQYVYPYEENKSVIGFSLLNDYRPQIRADVQRALTTRKPVISGPYELRQGRKGIVIRKAIYEGNEFWGLVSIVADMDPIYSMTGLNSSSDQVKYAIRNKQGLFYGDENVFESAPVLCKEVLFDDEFVFAAVPIGGWEQSIAREVIGFRIITFLIMVMILIIVNMAVTRALKINQNVKIKTEQLNKANELLEIELSNSKRLQADAEMASLAKSQFLTAMSHEIRTPMNGFIGMIQLLETTELTEDQAKYVEISKKSSDSLLNVINDILCYSKIEAGKLELAEQKFGFNEFINDLLLMFRTNAQNKGLILDCFIEDNLPPFLIGDSFRLRQILTNLINNAIKFTPQGRIDVSIRKIEETNEELKLKFEVRDTGIGIRQDKIKDIFNSFTQADSTTTREYGGTGLGLSICKSLVEMMKGEIGADSIEDKGSCFYFTCVLKKHL
ncbi:ATP-binding protein [Dehalobacter sp.]|jgi:signal transduction histidine kinase|uniref:ATP-binding protein n=1 Tax=Dehalobacter sp. TaxID=1962289 RepID=UPI00031FB5D2|nr:ATP-binding protein [Dehalobacter sp.]MCG1025403.1 CHASE domain-containing protein [Dehalobacter sp.]